MNFRFDPCAGKSFFPRDVCCAVRLKRCGHRVQSILRAYYISAGPRNRVKSKLPSLLKPPLSKGGGPPPQAVVEGFRSCGKPPVESPRPFGAPPFHKGGWGRDYCPSARSSSHTAGTIRSSWSRRSLASSAEPLCSRRSITCRMALTARSRSSFHRNTWSRR